MSSQATIDRPGPAGPAGGPGDVARHLHRGAGWGDRIFRTVALVSGLLVLAILVLIAVSTTREAWPAFQEQGISFVTSDDWNPAANQFGALALVYGTVYVSSIALVLAVPVSLGIALFSTEVAPRRLRRPVAYVIDLLAAVPSVVYGLWGVIVFAPNAQPVFQAIADSVGTWPVFSLFFAGPARGTAFLTAAIILAFMITPIITSLSREVISTVPRSQREAALAMGSTRWEMIRSAVMPWARGGIVGAVMLGLGRAMGETIAAALVIGSAAQVTLEVFQPGDSMAAVVANQFGQSEGLHRSALIGLGVVLFGLTILVNVAARGVIGRFDRKLAA